MTINLYYRYSELDKREEFYITCDEPNTIYQWVWFYLGGYMPDGVSLSPYKPHEEATLKQYRNPKVAEAVARKIVKRIKKELAK